jgi:hypothetical protein
VEIGRGIANDVMDKISKGGSNIALKLVEISEVRLGLKTLLVWHKRLGIIVMT